MTIPTPKTATDTDSANAFAMLAASIGESLGSAVGRGVTVRSGELEAHTAGSLLASLPRTCAVSTGTIDVAGEPRTLRLVVELPDAVAMVGLVLMTPEVVVAERRAMNSFLGDDQTGYSELCNVVYAGFDNTLRTNGLGAAAKMVGLTVVQPGDTDDAVFGAGQLAVAWFRLKLGEYPESRGCLVVDRSTADTWNRTPLALPGPGAPDDPILASIPVATVRGTLAAFVAHPEVFSMLRQSCRRVGLDLRRHGRGEIPNPSAHRGEIVLMDVPADEERRFDWCVRMKELSSSTRVMLLLHHPSRNRVMQAFQSGADAILGLPCNEAHLSQKLSTLLSSLLSEPPIP